MARLQIFYENPSLVWLSFPLYILHIHYVISYIHTLCYVSFVTCTLVHAVTLLKHLGQTSGCLYIHNEYRLYCAYTSHFMYSSYSLHYKTVIVCSLCGLLHKVYNCCDSLPIYMHVTHTKLRPLLATPSAHRLWINTWSPLPILTHTLHIPTVGKYTAHAASELFLINQCHTSQDMPRKTACTACGTKHQPPTGKRCPFTMGTEEEEEEDCVDIKQMVNNLTCTIEHLAINSI